MKIIIIIGHTLICRAFPLPSYMLCTCGLMVIMFIWRCYESFCCVNEIIYLVKLKNKLSIESRPSPQSQVLLKRKWLVVPHPQLFGWRSITRVGAWQLVLEVIKIRVAEMLILLSLRDKCCQRFRFHGLWWFRIKGKTKDFVGGSSFLGDFCGWSIQDHKEGK